MRDNIALRPSNGEWPQADPWPSAAWKQRLRRRLLAWFGRRKRDLPWRRTRDPYRVWVSEVMLQQTQVATVIPYFERFVAAFPTMGDLAAADEHDVLRLWEGLGYYRRARQLHRAVREVVRDHGGVFPGDPAVVRRLPGVGRYTAGAVLSIAYDRREPIVEANTLRLFSRLLAFRGDPRRTAGQRLLWSAATHILPRRGAGRLNQALMELGATVCLPKAPRCDDCPVAALCPTRAEGLQAAIPMLKQPRATCEVREAAIVVRRRGKVLLVRRDDQGRWAGLWDFPRFEIDAASAAGLRRELIAKTAHATGVAIQPLQELATLRHGVTRFRITLVCYEARYRAGRQRQPAAAEARWVRPADLPDYPMSVTGRELARLVADAKEES